MNNTISRYNLVLTICLVGLALITAWWFLNTRELRHLQPQLAGYQQREIILKQLVVDVLAYSEKHPDIDPILIGIGAKQPKSAPAPSTRR
jgi:hypothetical protein